MEYFQLGIDILNTSMSPKTRKILAQTGSVVGEGQTDSSSVEWWQHVGFASRPAKPVKGKQAPQAVVIRSGSIDAAVASQDLRGLELYGQLGYGETCIYAVGEDGASQGRILIKGDGSINLYTREGNGSGGTGMGVFVRSDGSIDIVSANKTALMIGTDGSIKLFNGSGGLSVDSDGSVKVSSSSKLTMSGSSISMGGPTAQPVALAQPLVTAIGALQIEIAAMATAITGIANLAGPIIPGTAPGTHGAFAAVSTAAVSTAATALALALPQAVSLRTTSD